MSTKKFIFLNLAIAFLIFFPLQDADAGKDWKEHATLRRVPIEHAGAKREPAGEYFLLEACCSSCGTLLDTDVVRGDDGPLHDRVGRVQA